MKKKIAAILIMILALSLTIMGIYRGEVAVVLKKAINICTECIGIG
ncbi:MULTISPECIES: CD1871A family CXXC motif-containing protein [unclassified Treponema]|nr:MULTISPECIES: CD1871A family CXXC motif-containing protein [unclassified Treponema]UTC67453.1 hypothetical protein E4O06_01930 [Treponema sp. OMZ 789]UTC70181.1 hypothetical protein E4O01_01920 [Treponema sp. OMZ 790]UTC72896.1 hypothetical protein E4O02_01920 [Treponema sp. OMZ 791]